MSQDLQMPTFDYRSTLIANAMVQLVMVIMFYVASNTLLAIYGALIAVVLYWLMAIALYKRRQRLSIIERVALRLGYGILLPISLFLAFLIRQCFLE